MANRETEFQPGTEPEKDITPEEKGKSIQGFVSRLEEKPASEQKKILRLLEMLSGTQPDEDAESLSEDERNGEIKALEKITTDWEKYMTGYKRYKEILRKQGDGTITDDEKKEKEVLQEKLNLED